VPGLSRSRASLRVMGDTLDPANISQLLCCEPHRAWRKGEIVPSGRIPRHSGSWSIHSWAIEGGDLEKQIAALLARTTTELEVWRNVSKRYRVNLFCGLFLEEWNEGLHLSPGILLAISQRNIELQLDIYGPDRSQEE
jgi:Domain of unknown function (DUF4279)